MQVYTIEADDYPKLMVSTRSGRIILFTAEQVGTQLNTTQNDGGAGLGHWSERWAIGNFVPYKGIVILSGDSNG